MQNSVSFAITLINKKLIFLLAYIRYEVWFMDILYPSKHIKKTDFSGKLLIDGDFEDNCILFRFLFDTAETVHPLLIWVRVRPINSLRNHKKRDRRMGRNIFLIECNIPDYNNPLMKTRLLYPDFQLKNHKIRVINIESQVSYRSCGFPYC
jgi:hypothetical protein